MKKKTLIIIIASVVTALIIIGLVCFLVFGKKNVYTVSFDTDSDVKIESIKIEEGKSIDLPQNLEKEGFTFNGWMLDKEIITSPYKPTKDVVLVAKWISNEATKFKITFDADNGFEPTVVYVVEGEKLSEPKNPVKDGYKFLGWYLNDAKYTEFDKTEITEEFTLKAKWEEDKKDDKNDNKKVDAESISLNKSSFRIARGNTETAVATINPSNATDKTVTWSSSNEGVATVNNGVITAVSKGSATISATTANGKVAQAEVNVYVPVSSIVLTESNNKTNLYYAEKADKQLVLKLKIEPSDADVESINWTVPNVGGQTGALTATPSADNRTMTVGVREGGPVGKMAVSVTVDGQKASYPVYKENTLRATYSSGSSGSNYDVDVGKGDTLTITCNEDINYDGNSTARELGTLTRVADNKVSITNNTTLPYPAVRIVEVYTKAGQYLKIRIQFNPA